MGVRHPSLGSSPSHRVSDRPLPPAEATWILPKRQAIRSVRFHQERAAEADRLLLRAIVRAHDDFGITFQNIADTLGCSKHWAWKLYQRGKELA